MEPSAVQEAEPSAVQEAEPSAAEQLSPWQEKVARLLLGRRHQWNPDIAMRYLPIVRSLRSTGYVRPIVDIGSGSTGIAPYLGESVIAVDPYVAGGSAHVLPVRASCLRTPFADASCPTVITVDMLEHVPAEDRPPTIAEMIRITRDTLIIAVPTGPDSQQHDQRMAQAYRDARGADYQYLLEHVEHGLPTEDQLKEWIFHALAQHGRRAQVRAGPNANLRVREWIMRRWIKRGLFDSAAWIVLIWFADLLATFNQRPAYRTIVRIDLEA